MYNLTLGNGTVFSGLTMNGSYFVSKSLVSKDTFNGWGGKCRVEAIDEDFNEWPSGDYTSLELLDIIYNGEAWFFAIRQIPSEELEKRQLRADVDFALMLGGANF